MEEEFASNEEMAKIGSREGSAGVAEAGWIKVRGVLPIPVLLDNHLAF